MGMNEKKSALRELYRRLRADYDAYVKWLLRQPEKEILRLAPDYLIRKAIIEAAKRYTRLRCYCTALPFRRSGRDSFEVKNTA